MKLTITIMGHLKGEQIDFLLGYYVLITLVNLKYKSLQIYKMRLEEGSFRSLHWLVGSLNHLAGPTGGFHGPLLPSTMAASFPSRRRPGGTRWECLSKRQVGRSLLNGGICTTTIRVLRRRDCKVGQVSFYVNRTTTSQ